MDQSFVVQLAAVVAVALAVVLVLWRASRARRQRDTAPARQTIAALPVQPAPALEQPPEPLTPFATDTTSEIPAPSTVAPSPVEIEMTLQQSATLENSQSLDAEIAASEAKGESAELAYLYIKHAAVYVAAGAREQAADRLRDAIRVAALRRLPAPHALARIELGDLYLENGDPITACEQWQIARNLLHDLGRLEERDGVDKRMLGNGCPTDWVLTDF